MAAIDIASIDAQFVDQGWSAVDAPEPADLSAIRDELEAKFGEIAGSPGIALVDYHTVVGDDRHEDILWQLSNHIWDSDIGHRIGTSQLSLFRALMGPDLMVQSRPFLRIARPSAGTDNIGMHRDSFYGQSPYEITVLVPLTDLEADNAIQVVPGSHTKSESCYDVQAMGDAPWPKGSPKNLMGFPYSPKKMAVDQFRDQLVPVPLRVGQMLIFTPSLIHGQEVNNGATTRVSIDVRLVNSFAPIEIRNEPDSRGYRTLSESAVGRSAREYFANN